MITIRVKAQKHYNDVLYNLHNLLVDKGIPDNSIQKLDIIISLDA